MVGVRKGGGGGGIANGQDMKINCKKILWFIMTDNERWDYLTRQLDRQAQGQTDGQLAEWKNIWK